ncbi:hypothetical protein QM806_35720 [Rhodococcus sp. IEGM 1351]|uniref:hypothetical protein n=1 Tax=Rhodococcus sp. IEGM 1351 TaxID=3047089 RepID=UPI0024B83367|nr:hypothetical protein [Rhodococcus sp. IEGM 1351]MDI9940708.1 hypothetical protein [Rhodococcus sp. IEGM 1351]
MRDTVSGADAPSREDANRILPIDIIQLLLFTGFAFSYSLYMSDLMPGTLYYTSMAAFIIFAAARVAWLVLVAQPRAPLAFGKSACALFGAAAVLVFLSIVQEINAAGDFSYTSFGAIIYIVIPVLSALCIANTVTLRLADVYMTVLLARYIFFFLISDKFSIEAIQSISWVDSQSPFESSFAHDLLVVGLYFVVRQKAIRAGLALAFTMLALKRASFLLSPLLIIFRRKIRYSPPPKSTSVLALFVVGAVSPFAVMAAYSQTSSEFFENNFGVDLNEFTSGRLSIYQLATNCAESSHAFGSLNICLSDTAFRVGGTTWNGLLHNDTLRVYMEVGLIGVVVYVAALSYASRTSRPAFILMMYAFFVLITSRLITHMSFWIVLFIAIALLERFQSSRDEFSGRGIALPEQEVRIQSTQRETK